MTRPLNVSDELLNSFIDNELESHEQGKLFDAIDQDPVLKERACELHGLKKMLQHAYTLSPEPAMQPRRKIFYWRPLYTQCLAASVLLLLFGGASGWMLSTDSMLHNTQKTARLIGTILSDHTVQEPDKIIVQVSNSNPIRLKAALDETENLLKAYQQSKQPLEIEVLANGSGVNLLRSGMSPFEQRVDQMKARYPNLHFFACNQTLNDLRGRGERVQLLPHTQLASSALDEINKRVRQGWDYVRA